MKIIAIIPARLHSKRFPGKVLKLFFGIPMLDHVRFRAFISGIFKSTTVISGDHKIIEYIKKKGGKYYISKKKHNNGTSRASEFSNQNNFDYAFILFADEPSILPCVLVKCLKIIKKNLKYNVFNVVTSLEKQDLWSNNIVKCKINKDGEILNYFRKSNKQIKKTAKDQGSVIYKSTGILIFKKKILDNYNNLKKNIEEKSLKIEQLKFLSSNIKVKSIFIKNILSSINTIQEMNYLQKRMKLDKYQIKIINKTKKFLNC